MSDKTAAHFVDATPSSGTPDTWSAKRDTRTVGSTGRVLLRCDIGFLSMPHTPTPKNLTAGETSADEGGGVFSFPCENHGFVAGQTVEFFGTTNYESDSYVVQAGSTTDRIHVANASPFVAETYDGTETVVRREVVNGGSFAVAGDTSGNIFVGIQNSAMYPTCLRKYSWDWTAQADAFFTPVGGWRGTGDVARSIRLSNDEDYVYLHVFTDNYHQIIYKLTVSDGTGIWTTQTAGGVENWSYGMDMDANEYIYVPQSDSTNLQRYDPTDGTLDYTYTGVKGNMNVCVSNTDNRVAVCGNNTLSGNKNVYITPLDSIDIVSRDLGGGVAGKSIWCLFFSGGFLYCVGNVANTGVANAAATIWKLSLTDLSTVASVNLTGAMWGAIDLNGNVIITLNSSGAADDYQYYVYDSDLAYVTKYKVEGMQVTITPQLNRGDSPTYPCITNGYGTSTTYGTPTQGRTVAYPDGYSHLEKESLCVLSDGAVHPKVTVSGGAISVTGTTTHAGLCYDGHLKPMKINGELYNKRIHHVEPNFYETIGGKIGESDSKMDTIQFRTGADPYDDSPDLFSGHKELVFDGSYSRQGDVQIEQESPLPMTVVGLGVKLDAEEL